MSIAKKVGLSIVAFIALLAVIAGIMFASGTLSYLTAPFRGAVDAQEQTQSGTYRIAAYEEFYNRCAAVQADEDRIRNIEQERETADEVRASQLATTLTAVQNSRAQKIREYNSASRQEATRGQFRDSGLPFELFIEGDTTCEA